MKRAFLKTAFLISVLILMTVLLVPAMVVLDTLFPVRRGAGGLYRGGHGLGPALIAMFICTWVADRITSFLFRSARISDDRWSIFKTRRS